MTLMDLVNKNNLETFEKGRIMNVKQVIIIRKDLKMRRGKECSQTAHASMAFMSNILRESIKNQSVPVINYVISEWVNGIFTKIVLQAENEETLLEIDKVAKEAGILSNLITDCGLTEFGGVPTITALALGPDESEKIDLITGNNGKFSLKLY